MKTELFNFTNDYNKNIIVKLGKKIEKGSIGIFPTDTVYGIGCNAFNENKIKELFSIKKRDFSKPINVLISDIKMLDDLVENISVEEKNLINAFWPGALTIIFNKKNTVSDILTSNLNTIGIRMPNNNIALNLIKSSNVPIATTSVNISGYTSGINVYDFIDDFNQNVDFIIDNGDTKIKKASTIVQIINNKACILREGSISQEQINKVLKNN